MAWESISVETVMTSFWVCGIANALNGSEDHLIWDDIPKDIDDGDSEDSISAKPENLKRT